MVETRISPRTTGRPAKRTMAGITDSLPACRASSKAPSVGFTSAPCASATRSGISPLAAATAPVSPSMEIADSSTMTPIIQKKTAFFAEPPSLALKIRWYMLASPMSSNMVGTKKLMAMMGPEISPVRSAAQLPNSCHFPADSATAAISPRPPTRKMRNKSAPRVPTVMSTPFTTSVYTTENIPASTV